MYTCLFFTCILIATVVLCILIWAIEEISKLSNVSDKDEKEVEEYEHVSFWFWIVLIGFLIEFFLCWAMYYIRKKVNPCGAGEQQFRIRDVQEIEMSHMQEITAEMQSDVEETPQESVSPRSFFSAYDSNRIDAIAERIRRAGDDMDRRSSRSHGYAPVPTDEVERY